MKTKSISLKKINLAPLMILGFLGIQSNAGGFDRSIINLPKEIRFKLDYELTPETDCSDVNGLFDEFRKKDCEFDSGKNVECDLIFQNLKMKSISLAKNSNGLYGPFSAKVIASSSVDLPVPVFYQKRFDRDVLKSILLNELPENLLIQATSSGIEADLIRKMGSENSVLLKRNPIGDLDLIFRNKFLFCQVKEGAIDLQNRMQVAYLTESTVGSDADRIIRKVIQDVEGIKKKEMDEFSKYFTLGMAIAHSFEGTQISKESLDQKIQIARSLEGLLMDHSFSNFKTLGMDPEQSYRNISNNRKLSYEKVIFSNR